MSYLTGLFLAFSGLAFGYLIRFRERNSELTSSESLAQENEELRTSLRIAQDSNSNLASRFSAQENQMDSIRQLSDEWSANHQQMNHELARLRTAIDDKTEKLNDLSHRLTNESRAYLALKDKAQVDAKQHSEEVGSLECDWQTRLIETESHLLQAQEDLTQSRPELNTGLQIRIDNQESTIQTLRADQAGLLDRLQHELESRRDSDAPPSNQSANHSSNLGDRNDDLETKLADTQADLATAVTQLEQSDSQTRALTVKVEELKTTCQRISELEKLVKSRDQEGQQVSAELRHLREKYASSLHQQEQLQAKLDGIMASDGNVLSFTDAIAQRNRDATVFDQEYGGPTVVHPERGTIYTSAPEHSDDLKLISGIAEVLEARLNDYGIHTFKQILNWTPTIVEEFSRLLTFKNRIEHDDWVAQAKTLFDNRDNRSESSAA